MLFKLGIAGPDKRGQRSDMWEPNLYAWLDQIYLTLVHALFPRFEPGAHKM